VNDLEQLIKKYNLDEKELEEIIKNYQKQKRRFEKILKLADKQQNKLLQLNEELRKKEKEIRELYEYDYTQQQIAKSKVNSTIINELEGDENFIVKTVFLASDILSGDFYSIFKIDNRIVYFVIDGQGHGISPAFTVFSVASIFRDYVKVAKSLNELLKYLISYVRSVLLDSEQLSFTFIELDFKKEILNYAIGGMYPTYLKFNNDDIIKIKANNLPILNFTFEIEVNSLNISGFKSILSYTDGIIEHDISLKFHPKKLIKNPSLIDELKNLKGKQEDDITVVYIEKKG
jgi:serine phosphatase RsbU (regulator of sigma subunit)